jgi:hypothetical protein
MGKLNNLPKKLNEKYNKQGILYHIVVNIFMTNFNQQYFSSNHNTLFTKIKPK